MNNILKNIIICFLSLCFFNGCNPEGKKKDIYTNLWWASIKGDFTEIQEAINKGADINAPEYQNKKNTILFEVIYHENESGDPSGVINYLISQGSNVNITNSKGETPLMCCFLDLPSFEYTLKILSILLKAGANPNIQDKEGNTALIYAYLYSENSDNRNKIFKALIDNGADVNIKNKEGRTALSYITTGAVAEYDIEIVKMLLKAGADVNVKDIEGKTPLMNAYHDKEIADLLREYGAQEPDNEKFMFFVELKKDQPDYKKIETYLEKLSVNEKDMYYEYTPLQTAVSRSNIKLLNFLIAKGADINMKSGISDNCTPLMFLIYDFRYDSELERKMDMLRNILTNKNLNINEIGGCCERDTALDIALRIKNEIVEENRSSKHIDNVIKELHKYGAKTYEELMKEKNSEKKK